MKLMKTAIPIALLANSLFASLSATAAESPNDVVAKMGSIEIKRTELEQMLSLAKANTPEARPPLQAIDQALRAELLRRALMEEAQRAAWDKRPEVQQQLERAREQVIVTSFIDQQARPAANYPSESEIQSAYEANKAKLVQPPQVHLAQIYLPDAAADARRSEAAEDIWKQASKKGADFASLARKHSKHSESAAKGGDMGWLQADLLVPEIRSTAQQLAVGEISKPIKSSTGWHILKVLERKAATQRTLAEARENLIQSLRLKKAQENEQQYLNQLVAKTPITINEIAISSHARPTK